MVTLIARSNDFSPVFFILDLSVMFYIAGSLFLLFSAMLLLGLLSVTFLLFLVGITLDCFFFFWLSFRACGILVPRPKIKPEPPALAAWSLNHWIAR